MAAGLVEGNAKGGDVLADGLAGVLVGGSVLSAQNVVSQFSRVFRFLSQNDECSPNNRRAAKRGRQERAQQGLSNRQNRKSRLAASLQRGGLRRGLAGPRPGPCIRFSALFFFFFAQLPPVG